MKMTFLNVLGLLPPLKGKLFSFSINLYFQQKTSSKKSLIFHSQGKSPV